MAHCAPESPCSPPMSPSSEADLQQKCKSSSPMNSNLAIPVSTNDKPDVVATEEPKKRPHGENENEDALSAITDNEPAIVLNDVHVRIQKRPNQLRESDEIEYETVILPSMTLPDNPTLHSIREALLQSELGRAERDIFFPTWTKSIYISWQLPADNITTADSETTTDSKTTNDKSNPDPTTTTTPAAAAAAAADPIFSEPDTIDTDTALQSAIAREQAAPGTLCLLLQECRNARYSRKRDKRTSKSRPHSPNPVFNPNLFYGQTPLAFPVYAEAGVGKSCSDGTVYFDGPLTFGYPLHPGFGCTPAHSGAMGYAPEFTYMPPFAVMPFMYAPHNAQH